MQGYQTLFEISKRVNWQIDDLVGERFDFAKPFLPEAFARTGALAFLSAKERLTLNHVRARGYLALFELVETFVEPFVAAESRAESADMYRGPALAQFASEETKHMELFRRVLRDFDDEFGVDCDVIGPAADIRAAVLAHDPLAVVILTLALEWMSQGHYLESVKDDDTLDARFKSLLKHHWMEECQHARLDGLMLLEMAAGKSANDVDQAMDQYLEMVAFFDGGFREQAKLDMASFERAARRTLSDAERETFVTVQHQALRWTFLGSAMQNRNFQESLNVLGSSAVDRVRKASEAYR
jgi:hypothetical protein